MVKVVDSRDDPLRIKCGGCSSALEFQRADAFVFMESWNPSHFIICPVCARSIDVQGILDNGWALKL